MLAKFDFTTSKAYQYLSNHYIDIAPKHLKDLFDSDPQRALKFSIRLDDILFDYSKNRINDETIALLMQLARECKLSEAMNLFFSGALINNTEHRAVLHTALRNQSDNPIFVEGEDVMPEV